MRTTKSPIVHLRKTSIMITDLPPELLSIIFKFIHDSTTLIRLEKDIIPSWARMEGPETHPDDDDDQGSDDDLDGFEPELARLVIDGKNFCQPLEHSNYWIHKHGLIQLTIAQYTPR